MNLNEFNRFLLVFIGFKNIISVLKYMKKKTQEQIKTIHNKNSNIRQKKLNCQLLCKYCNNQFNLNNCNRHLSSYRCQSMKTELMKNIDFVENIYIQQLSYLKRFLLKVDDEKDITKYKDYILSHDPTKYMIHDLINNCNGKLDSKLIDTIYNC